ncbi:hypothetical protein [Amycolatopsis kentuckyensis]|uniref:hypothetical protein n=1 Tax=Amycolatopsis kentuckyensis TaxID=218823 RepID=UPI003561AA3C
MKSALARAVTVFLTAAAVTLTGVGVASAGGPGGSGSSSTTSAAAQVQSLRDQLVSRADNGDVAGTRVTLTDLDPVLTDLAQGKRYTIQAETRDKAATAQQQTTEAREGVDRLAADLKARQSLPPVSALLNALLQRVLISLSALVNDLLGGLPVPIG